MSPPKGHYDSETASTKLPSPNLLSAFTAIFFFSCVISSPCSLLFSCFVLLFASSWPPITLLLDRTILILSAASNLGIPLFVGSTTNSYEWHMQDLCDLFSPSSSLASQCPSLSSYIRPLRVAFHAEFICMHLFLSGRLYLHFVFLGNSNSSFKSQLHYSSLCHNESS